VPMDLLALAAVAAQGVTAAKVSSTESSNIEELLHFAKLHRETVAGKAVEKYLSVALFGDPVVQQREALRDPSRPTISRRSPASKPAPPEDLVVVERIPPCSRMVPDSGFHHRIARAPQTAKLI